MADSKIDILRHSYAHLMAAAVQSLYPGTKFGIGPVINDGFYYDFEFTTPISAEDLPKIEKKIKELIEKDDKFVKEDVSKDKARQIFKDQPYKLELIDELEDDQITTYTSGDFVDLCRGPHVESSKQLRSDAFKLTTTAGAYWRGSEKNTMLTRIYGAAFADRKELAQHLKNQEEAAKRDHRRIGKDLELFSIDEYVGPGLVLWHPKLSTVREEIELYWRKEHRKRGYQYVYTPHIGLSNLWEKSGHLDFFKEGMYPPMDMANKDKKDKTTYYVKPMNCPFHVRIYKTRPRSYRELPLRWCELGSVYRYEESGVLHGMMRVRGLTQDDAHIICREDQFVEEVNQVLDFALSLNKDFGYEKLNVYLAVRGSHNEDKYIGDKKIWDFAEKTLEDVLSKRKITFTKDIDGAKFYGPSIDLKVVDAMGREWQGTTIQLDMNLPSKFGMTYKGQDGKDHTPIMLHRTLLGSMERFVGTLIEHYAGAFPTWLSPTQVSILPISSAHHQYAQEIAAKLKEKEIRVEIQDQNDTVGKKIREGEMQKIPHLLIVGDKEIEAQSVGLRSRNKGDVGMIKIDKFIEQIVKEINNKS